MRYNLYFILSVYSELVYIVLLCFFFINNSFYCNTTLQKNHWSHFLCYSKISLRFVYLNIVFVSLLHIKLHYGWQHFYISIYHNKLLYINVIWQLLYFKWLDYWCCVTEYKSYLIVHNQFVSIGSVP